MKRLALLAISLLTAITAFGNVASYAAESDTIYPSDEDFIKTLEFGALSDYAVNGEAFAFAEEQKVSVFNGGNLTEYEFGAKVTAVDCAEDTFYCAVGDGTVYSLPYAEGQNAAEHVMPEPETMLKLGKFIYLLEDTTLKVVDTINDKVHKDYEGEFKNLKQFGERVYAMSENAVWTFNGAESEKLIFKYADYSCTQSIAVGQAATALKAYSEPEIVTVKTGAFMTETDLTSVPEKFFAAGDTVTAKENATAILLCTTGNAAIIAIGMDCYILLSSNVELTEESCYSAPDYEYAKITAAGDRIYSSPYVSEGTAIMTGAAGLIVKVLHKVEHTVLDTAFFEVEFTAKDGTTAKGYINGKFLIKVDHVAEDDKKPDTVTDPDYTEESNTKTILIVFAVVILVLAAVGYLAFTATSDKRKNKKEKKTQPEPENK